MQHHLDAQNRFIRETYPGTEPLERILTLDLETRSTADLKKTGAWVYASDPSTEVMCASFAIDDGSILRWLETDPISLPEATPMLMDPRTLCCFHNAEFEAAILLHVYGIEIPTHRILDSAAVARHAGLPGALDPLGQFFGVEKDMEGSRTMLKLSKPRRPSKSNPDLFWRPDTKPEDFEKTYAYCDRDVEVAQTALSKMPAMSVFECQVYAATFEMNRRGAPIDRPSAEIMKDTADREKTRLSREIEREFGFTLGQVSEIAGFLGLDSVAKAPLRDLLKDDALHPDHRRVAEARQTFAKTSLNKLPAFIGRSQHDSRAHDNLMYGGAERTLRWSGSGIQLQNLTRGIGKLQEIAFEALHAGLFEFLYEGEIIDILSGMLRGLIRDEAGLLIGDYSQIEARMLAWLVGDTDLLDQFRRGEDPYRIMASKIYHKAVADVTGDERFMGKQTILGCGYGLGHRGFLSMLDTTYDVQIPVSEAQTIVQAYRRNAPKEVSFWKKVERAMLLAKSKVGKIIKINEKVGITFPKSDEMHLILPSGRRLRYYQVKLERIDDGFAKWSCFGRLKTGAGYGRVSIYGGALTGHITQSSARDVVAHALVEMWKRGYPLILTVHDELVSLKHGTLETFEEIMSTPPAWLTEFPLAVDTFETVRYRK